MTRACTKLLPLFVLLSGCRTAPDSLAFADRAPTAPPAKLSVTTTVNDSKREILAASNLPALQPTPRRDDAAQVSIHHLSNGLTVFVSPNHQTPRIAAWVAVRTGSRNDPAHSTGLAHYLEHMLFKGTDELGTTDIAAERPHLRKIAELYNHLRQAKDANERNAILQAIDRETQAGAKFAIPNEFDHLYAAMGAQGVNAYTWTDETVYTVDIPSNRLDAWAKVESERFRDAEFRLFYPELEAVYEEKNRGMDMPSRRVWESLARALYPNHPYGTQSTIGEIDHLKIPAFGDMVAYYHRWYTPNNMAIVLAGDVDPQSALPLLERTFGQWQPKALELPPPITPGPLNGRVAVEVVAPGEQAVHLAWRTVPTSHPDTLAIEVLDRLLNDGNSGLLAERVLLPQKLPDASSGTEHMFESGSFSFEGTARDGQSLSEVEALLQGVVAALVAGEFSDEAFAAAKLNLEIDLKRQLETNEGRAQLLTNAYVARQPWSEVTSRVQKLQALTREDVLRVAKTYLGPNYVALHRKRGEFTPPRIEKPTITPLPIDPTRHTPFYHRILAMPRAAIEPQWLQSELDFQRRKLKSGELFASQNRRNDLFTVSFVFDHGLRRDPLICHALDLAALSGAGEWSAVDFQRKLYELGTRLSHQCTADRVRISISGVDRNLDASVALLETWLRSANLTAQGARDLASNTISLRRDQIERPEFLNQALFAYASRASQSEVLSGPSNAKLQSTPVSALKQSLARLADTEHNVHYYGPRTAQDVEAAITLGRGQLAAKTPAPRTWRKVSKPAVYFFHLPISQAQIRLIFAHAPLDSNERALATLVNEYLSGGMGSLIFQEIREARGLAYSSHAVTLAGIRVKDEAGLSATLGTQVDKAPEALKVLLELLHRPVSPERLAVAKQSLEESLRSERIDPRDVPATVQAWQESGENGDPRARYREIIAATTPQQLEAFLQSLAQKPPIVSILANKQRLDLAAIRTFGEVHEVELDELVPYGNFSEGGDKQTMH